MIRVLLVDDDALVRAGLTLMLRGAADIEVVGEAADGTHIVELVRECSPDVVLMDIRMPVLDGIAATRKLAEAGTTARVIVLTTFGEDSAVLEAIRAGAAGYLLKHTKPEEIVASVQAAAEGRPALSPNAARALLNFVAEAGPRNAEQARRRLEVLTDRERAVAAAVADGLANPEIGERLHLSTGTVKAHVSSALSKLDLDNRIQLALLAHDASNT